MTAALVAGLLSYWAPDHELFNRQVIREGSPFHFSRSGEDVRTVDDYLQRVLYVSDGKAALVRGVSFMNDPRGGDKPTDPSDSSRSLQDWNVKGGLWEDGFEDMGEATS